MVAFSVKVQEVAAGRTPFENVNVLLPTIPERFPPQVPVLKLGGSAMTMPAGMLSVKVMPFSAELFGLINCTLRTEDAPPKTVRGLNPLTTWMPIGSTRILAVAFATGLRVVAVPWIVPITFVVGIVFVYVAVTPRPMTLTTIVHLPGTAPTWAGMVPPVRTIFLFDPVKVRVPPQSVEAFGGTATRMEFATAPPGN